LRYFELYNLAPISYVTINTQGLIVEANLTASTLLGVPRRTLVKQPLTKFIFPNDQDVYFLHRKQLVEAGMHLGWDMRLLGPDGVSIWVNIIAILAENGECRITLSKIDERKQAEEELRRLSRHHELILCSVEEGILGLDAQGKHTFVNPAAAKMLGYQAEELIGQPSHSLWHHSKADGSPYPDAECLIERAYRDGFDYRRSSEVFWRKDGSSFPVEYVSTPITELGRSTGAVLTFTDISGRQLAEQEKNALQAHLNQAQKMEAIGTLAGGIAHDFNNILTIILGFTEMVMADAPPDSGYAKDLDHVLTAARRASDLVKQILTFSRQSITERMPLELKPLIKESVKMLRAALPSTISIKESIDPQPMMIMADPTQVHQIVMNLCTNAFHAMESKGGILAIDLHAAHLDSQTIFNGQQLLIGDYVELTISDTGTGIAPAIMPKIFDPYFTTKVIGKGTGLGLAIAQGIIKGYGGAITVSSTLGQGTTFRIYFPAICTAPTAVAEPQEIPRGTERILFVDDEKLIVEMGKNILERLGYTVTAHDRSIEALVAFMDDPTQFDLVITDLTMPGLTGVEFAKQMLSIRPELPIILCTGFSQSVDEESIKALGIKGFALKPLLTSALGQLIRTLLDGGGD
jgi:PAS domain S-box-containing protein